MLFACGCPNPRCHCDEVDQFSTFGQVCVHCAVGNHINGAGNTFETDPLYADIPQLAMVMPIPV